MDPEKFERLIRILSTVEDDGPITNEKKSYPVCSNPMVSVGKTDWFCGKCVEIRT